MVQKYNQRDNEWWNGGSWQSQNAGTTEYSVTSITLDAAATSEIYSRNAVSTAATTTATAVGAAINPVFIAGAAATSSATDNVSANANDQTASASAVSSTKLDTALATTESPAAPSIKTIIITKTDQVSVLAVIGGAIGVVTVLALIIAWLTRRQYQRILKRQHPILPEYTGTINYQSDLFYPRQPSKTPEKRTTFFEGVATVDSEMSGTSRTTATRRATIEEKASNAAALDEIFSVRPIDWSVAQTLAWLRIIGHSEAVVDVFRTHGCDGRFLKAVAADRQTCAVFLRDDLQLEDVRTRAILADEILNVFEGTNIFIDLPEYVEEIQ
ncbi:hypothetical protein HK100_007442, partial [Physocladia obscura]